MGSIQPGEVRKRIEKKTIPIVAKDTYKKLCELAIHPTPASIYSSHFTIENRIHVGAHFSVIGLQVVFSQMAMVVAPTLMMASDVYGPPVETKNSIEAVARALSAAANKEYGVTSFRDQVSAFRSEYLKDMMKAHLARMLPAEWDQLERGVQNDLMAQGLLTSVGNDQQFKDPVFGEVAARLQRLIERRLSDEDTEWFNNASAVALAEQTNARAQQFALHASKPSID